MIGQVHTVPNADICGIARAVEFRDFIADPSWYERYWLKERAPASHGGIRTGLGCFFRICTAFVTGSAFAVERYGSWPVSEDEAGI